MTCKLVIKTSVYLGKQNTSNNEAWMMSESLSYSWSIHLIEAVSSGDVRKHSWVFVGVVDCTKSRTNMAAFCWVMPPYVCLAYSSHRVSLASRCPILAMSRNCRILSSLPALSLTCWEEVNACTWNKNCKVRIYMYKKHIWSFLLSIIQIPKGQSYCWANAQI